MVRLYKIIIPCLAALVFFELWIISTGINQDASAADFTPPHTLTEAAVSQLESMAQDDVGRFIIELNESNTRVLNRTQLADPIQQRVMLVNELQTHTASTQQNLQRFIHRVGEAEELEIIQTFWIVNAMAIEGSKEAIATVANHPSIKSVRPDTVIQKIDPSELEPAHTQERTNWGLLQSNVYDAWGALGTKGDGVTVGIMDTGVDWEHQILRQNYRGLAPDGSVEHDGHWFHAAIPTQTVPTDTIGHGTHVAGSAVGINNIGVAPEAKWVGVSIADEDGLIFESYVHAAFEWFLQPNGDPSLAPDIINGSWGGPHLDSTFEEDIKIIQAAGIIPVFSAGNSGPAVSSINTPAGFEGVISVGASDHQDELAWFSSRGPSIWTEEPKPLISAPGTAILSSLPGNMMGWSSGTSMATPQVAGAVALLLSVNPTLTLDQISSLLAETAQPYSLEYDLNIGGHGILDAHALVASQLNGQLGTLSGQLLASSIPTPDTTITVTNDAGESFTLLSREDGSFETNLLPGTYRLTSDVYGHNLSSDVQVNITAEKTTVQNINMARLSSGSLSGAVTSVGQGIAATLEISGTQTTFATDPNGAFDVFLPVGTHTLRAVANGYTIVEKTVNVVEGSAQAITIELPKSQSILFVDADRWTYNFTDSSIPEALDAAGLAYDYHEFKHIFDDVVISETLKSYDVVVWSSVSYSPGFIQSNGVISDYMDSGGNVILIGPNVALFDANSQTSEYLEDYMRYGYDIRSGTRLTPTQPVEGIENSPYAGINFELEQLALFDAPLLMNELDIRRYSTSKPILEYGANRDELADADPIYLGVEAGHCKAFKATLFGFNFENIPSQADRIQLLENSLDYFEAPRITSGVKWLSTPPSPDFAIPGESNTYEFLFRNMSETVTETFEISLDNEIWTNTIMTPTVTVPPCGIGKASIRIKPDKLAPANTTQTLQITAQGTQQPESVHTLTLAQKTPGTVLLVDDHRWYDQSDKYGEALETMGLDYDVWQTSGDARRGSPSLSLLDQYEFVIWYTAYDWFRPISSEENSLIVEYLEKGGRLYLSSQDYMFYHANTELTQQYFGATDYMESVTPTFGYNSDLYEVSASASDAIPIVYDQYRNNADALIYGEGVTPILWHNKGVGGIANQGVTEQGNWRTMLWSIPFETLPRETRISMMEGIVGWLSDVGDSTIEVDEINGTSDTRRQFTITLQNSGIGTSQNVTATNQLPDGLTLDPLSLSEGAIYDPVSRTINWSGNLPAGESHIIQYVATASEDGIIYNPLTIAYGENRITFSKRVAVWNNVPNLSASGIQLSHNGPSTGHLQGQYVLRLENHGTTAAEGVSMTTTLSEGINIMTNTLQTTVGEASSVLNWISWNGRIAPGEAITISFSITDTQPARSEYLVTNMRINEESGLGWFIYDQTEIKAFEGHFPLINPIINRND